MCYAFRDWVVKRMDGGEHYYYDNIYDDYIGSNNMTNVINNVNKQLETANNTIDYINKQIETKQKELNDLIKQYKLIIKTYPVIDIDITQENMVVLDSTSDIKTGLHMWSEIPNIIDNIKKTYSTIRRLKKSKHSLTNKTKPLETNANKLDSFLHKDLTSIDTVLKPVNSEFYVQTGGNINKYKHKYLKYKMKYIQLKKTLGISIS